jgi:sugar/nucleoside kinase (ribokinase family)
VPEFHVSVVGELNLDLILYGLPTLEAEREQLANQLSLTLGSSSAIFAHNLACLGNRVLFTSAVAPDSFGEVCLERLGQVGVDIRGVRKLAGQTTGLTVIIPQNGRRYILTYPGTMHAMRLEDLDFDYLLNAKHLHVSSYYLQKNLRRDFREVFRRAKEAGLSTSLDTNDDPDDAWGEDLLSTLAYVDIFLPNEREALKIARADRIDEAAPSLAKLVSVLAVKRGNLGAVVWSRGEMISAPALPMDAVDTVGAGDSFDAGFIHQYVRGAPLSDCLKFAGVVGALSVTRAGGTEAFRDGPHRERFIERNWPAWTARNRSA